MIPCPACGLHDATGALLRGLVRRQRKGLLPGERVYQCRDCRQLWRSTDAEPSMVVVRETIETTAAEVRPALSGVRGTLLGRAK